MARRQLILLTTLWIACASLATALPPDDNQTPASPDPIRPPAESQRPPRELLELPEDQLEQRLQDWPRFQSMPPERKEEFKKRLTQAREKFRQNNLQKQGDKQDRPDRFDKQEGRMPPPALLEASEQDLDKRLQEWPRFQSMPPERKEEFKKRLAQAREKFRNQATAAAKEKGLSIPPDKQEEFIKDYWRERRQIEQQLRQEFEPRRKALEEAALERLRATYTSPTK